VTNPTDNHNPGAKARSSLFLLLLIVVAAWVVILQYTRYRLFSVEKTSTLWGVLVGMILGGFIFGWLRLRPRD
jgi:Na+/H+ antiporter NhaC